MTTTSTQTLTPALARYARGAAEAMILSLEHYGRTSPACGDGRMGTPAYYANRLGKILNHTGDTLPGNDTDWWGDRWETYAKQILETVPADEPVTMCAAHPAFAADYCPSCGTAATI